MPANTLREVLQGWWPLHSRTRQVRAKGKGRRLGQRTEEGLAPFSPSGLWTQLVGMCSPLTIPWTTNTDGGSSTAHVCTEQWKKILINFPSPAPLAKGQNSIWCGEAEGRKTLRSPPQPFQTRRLIRSLKYFCSPASFTRQRTSPRVAAGHMDGAGRGRGRAGPVGRGRPPGPAPPWVLRAAGRPGPTAIGGSSRR